MGKYHEIKQHLALLACASILLALLVLTPYFVKRLDNRKAVSDEFTASSFYYVHILDPAVEGYRFTSWSRQNWVSWLEHRTKLFRRAFPTKQPNLNMKPLNSVFVSSPSQFISSFEHRRYQFDETTSLGNNHHPQSGSFWSDTIFESFVFERKGSSYRIFRCPPMFAAVALVNGLPVHLHRVSKLRENGNQKVKLTRDCVELE